jgi:hypothetical protein
LLINLKSNKIGEKKMRAILFFVTLMIAVPAYALDDVYEQKSSSVLVRTNNTVEVLSDGKFVKKIGPVIQGKTATDYLSEMYMRQEMLAAQQERQMELLEKMQPIEVSSSWEESYPIGTVHNPRKSPR